MRFIFIFFIFIFIAEAKTVIINYKISYGVFGKIGIVKAKIKTSKNKYLIDISAKTTGLAKIILKDVKERHISIGKIKDGIMLSTLYQVYKIKGNKRTYKRYIPNYKEKYITKIEKNYINNVLKDKNKKKLNFFSTNDILSIFFNIKKVLKKNPKKNHFSYLIIGITNPKKKVEIRIPSKKEIKKDSSFSKKNVKSYLNIIVNKKIFGSKKGEIYTGIAKDGYLEKALIKNVVLFGDLTISRENP